MPAENLKKGGKFQSVKDCNYYDFYNVLRLLQIEVCQKRGTVPQYPQGTPPPPDWNHCGKTEKVPTLQTFFITDFAFEGISTNQN